MYDKKYRLRYLPLFYEDLDEKITYIAEKLKIPKLPVTCWIKLRKPYWSGNIPVTVFCYLKDNGGKINMDKIFLSHSSKNKDYVRPIPDSIINPVSSRCSIIWDCYKLNSLVEFKNEKGL